MATKRRRAKKFSVAGKVGKALTSAPGLAVAGGAGLAGAGYALGRPSLMNVGGQIMAIGGSGAVAQQALKHPKVLHLLHLDNKGRVTHVTTHRVKHAKKLKKLV